MTRRHPVRGDPDTDEQSRATIGGGAARHGSVAATAAVVVGFHAIAAAAIYPVVAAVTVGLAAAAFAGGVGVAAAIDGRSSDGDGDRRVCVPGTDTCVDV